MSTTETQAKLTGAKLTGTEPARTQPRRRAWVLVLAGVAVAGGLAGYGIWSRYHTTSGLKKDADDASIPRVQVISPKAGPPQRTLTLPGNMEAWYQASIYGQVSGYVSHWYKDYGAEVKAGDVLATVETPSLDAQLAASQANLATVEARYKLAAVTAQRWTALAGTQAVSKQDVDVKKADAAAQKAEVAAAQQDVARYEAQVAFKKLVAPFNGIVTARNVNIGDYVGTNGGNSTQRAASSPLFAVADMQKLRIFVSVPQDYSDSLKPGLSAELTLPQDPDKQVPLQFLTTAKAVSTPTRTIVTEFTLDNPRHEYWPGTYANVHFTFPSDPNVLIVPEQALLFRAQGMQVALVGDEDRVHLQDVTLGNNLGTEVQVVSGLKTTDRMISNPSLGLLEGQQVKIVQPVQGYQPSSSSGPSQGNKSQPSGATGAQAANEPKNEPKNGPKPGAGQQK